MKLGDTKEAIIAVRNSFEWCTVTNVRDPLRLSGGQNSNGFPECSVVLGEDANQPDGGWPGDRENILVEC